MEDHETFWISNLDWKPLNNMHESQLCKPFEIDEVSNIIVSMSNGKAPGPDDFPTLFYKKCWHILKEDLMAVMLDFQNNCMINNVRNTFIALIGKKECCSYPSDYRPISLTTSLYKIIAKSLQIGSKRPSQIWWLKTKWLSSKEGKLLMHKNQMAFIKGRQITHAILIANEAIDFWRSKKTKGFILKLDIEKASDKIR